MCESSHDYNDSISNNFWKVTTHTVVYIAMAINYQKGATHSIAWDIPVKQLLMPLVAAQAVV